MHGDTFWAVAGTEKRMKERKRTREKVSFFMDTSFLYQDLKFLGMNSLKNFFAAGRKR